MSLKSQALDAPERAQRRAALEARARELLAAPRPTTLEDTYLEMPAENGG